MFISVNGVYEARYGTLIYMLSNQTFISTIKIRVISCLIISRCGDHTMKVIDIALRAFNPDKCYRKLELSLMS